MGPTLTHSLTLPFFTSIDMLTPIRCSFLTARTNIPSSIRRHTQIRGPWAGRRSSQRRTSRALTTTGGRSTPWISVRSTLKNKKLSMLAWSGCSPEMRSTWGWGRLIQHIKLTLSSESQGRRLVERKGSMVSGDGQVYIASSGLREQHINAIRYANYALSLIKAQMSQVMMSRWTSE